MCLGSDQTVPGRWLHGLPSKKTPVGANCLELLPWPPVLSSIGWRIPLSGKTALYALVRSAEAFDEICTLLSSVRSGSADAPSLNDFKRFWFQ